MCSSSTSMATSATAHRGVLDEVRQVAMEVRSLGSYPQAVV
jgi:hypothetical protein